MKIKYEMNGNFCLTECPFGKGVIFELKSTIIRVGSLACQSCEDNMIHDKAKQEVECRFGEEVNESEI